MFTPALSLPYLLSNQSQKHVTINEALSLLDVHTHLIVQASDLAAPPNDVTPEHVYLVADDATDDWQGHDRELAWSHDGAWRYLQPQSGWLAWFVADAALKVFNGEAWIQTNSDLSQLSEFGVNTVPDSYNRLAVKSDAVLFSHDDITPGSGDIRLQMNRKDSTGLATLLWSTGYSANSEIGVTPEGFALKYAGESGDLETVMLVTPDDKVELSKSLELAEPLRLNPSSPDDGTLLAVFGIERAWALEQHGGSSSAALAFRSLTPGSKSIVFFDLERENSIRITPSSQQIRIGDDRVLTVADLDANCFRAKLYAFNSIPDANQQGAGALILVTMSDGSAQLAYSDGAQWLGAATNTPLV